MGILQNTIEKIRAGKQERKHMEDVNRWEEQVEQKKLSANERELMQYAEEDRQERMKIALDKIRKTKQREHWSGRKNNALDTPNIIKNSENIFAHKESMFGHKDNLLHQKNMFANEKNLFTNQKNMFAGHKNIFAMKR